MKRAAVLLPMLLPVGAAQSTPTCETIMADLDETAATQSVTRTLTMNAGDRELSRSVVRVAQGENGLEVTTLEQRGQLPPGLNCEGTP